MTVITRDRVSVIIPSRARPDRLREAVDSLLDTAYGVEVILVLDPSDLESHVVAGDECQTLFLDDHATTNTAALWNAGAAMATGDFFVAGADDLVFLDNWLDIALAKMEAMGGSGVVALNDNEETFGSLAAHFIMSRSYATRMLGGVIFPPVYEHGYTDVEVTWRAAQNNRLVFAKDAKLLHNHPIYGLAETDQIYEKAALTTDRDAKLFAERKASGFPVTWESVIADGAPSSNWGRVAIGLRSYKFPEPLFLDSWTGFVMSGLRNGDLVLEIKHGQPTHVSANELARDLLTKTDCDSILFIDDDMSFEAGALSKLRDNPDSADYDIVMGFCTFKTSPPHAVVFRLEEEQPGMPELLGGEAYGAMANVPDNEITDVDAVGLAFTLVKRHVFEKLVEGYGPEWTVWFDWGRHSEGEDIRFSRRCREAGFRLGVDAGVKIGHIGRYVFGWNEHQQFVTQLENNYG